MHIRLNCFALIAVTFGASALDTPAFPEPQATSQIVRPPGEPGGTGERVETSYASLHLHPWTSDAKGRVELRFQVEPAPGIRIYAPGQKGYEPVSLTFHPGDGVKAGRLEMPAPEPYMFEPTAEKLLVYKQPFVAVQHATLDTGAGAWRSGRIRATLRYQACDEALCYKPESVLLIWERSVKPPGKPVRDP